LVGLLQSSRSRSGTASKELDSGFRRNDEQKKSGLSQLALNVIGLLQSSRSRSRTASKELDFGFRRNDEQKKIRIQSACAQRDRLVAE